MPDEIKVGAAKFNRILDRMLEAKLQSKAEISARIKSARGEATGSILVAGEAVQ